MNLGPLGFWSQLDTNDIASQAIQGFGGLFLEMNNTIVLQAIGQGVAGEFLPNRGAWTSICLQLGFKPAFCEMLWDDPLYGFFDQNNYEIWIRWAYYFDTDSEMVLYKYFGFKKIQMAALGKLLK